MAGRRRGIGMNTHVDSHLLRLAEAAAAGVALKRLLARVGADVLAQVVPPPESLAAVRALEHRHRSLRRDHRHSQRLQRQHMRLIFTHFLQCRAPDFGRAKSVAVRSRAERRALRQERAAPGSALGGRRSRRTADARVD